MKAVLGLDTSCYTTSAALVSTDGRLLAGARRLLSVQQGGSQYKAAPDGRLVYAGVPRGRE